MAKRVNWTRRELLVGAAAGVGALAAPGFLTPRKVKSQANPDAPVKHLILMYAAGGLRCSAAFNAGTSVRLNPYGVLRSSRGWRVGAIFDDQRIPIPSLNTEIPSITELSDVFSILGNVDHVPGAWRGDGGHGTGYLRMGTGDPTGSTAGLHTIINQEIGLPTGVPAVIVGKATWAFGLPGELGLSARPVVIRTRDQAREFLTEFDDDVMDVNGATLREAFAKDGLWGRQSALAVRLIQKGSPAVAIGQRGYDTHRDEAGGFDMLMDSYGRALQGLHFALTHSPHPLGGTYWDHTMILGVSEFGRDNTSELTGFNRRGGSDHQGTNASRYQTFPIGGGMITPGVVVGDVEPKDWNPINGEVFSSRQVLATVLASMGIDRRKFGFGREDVIEGIFRARG